MISVIIPSYNSEKTIARCLHSLSDQIYDGEYEIIVVDSSADGTPKIISEKFPAVKLIYRAEKTLPGTARNLGLEIANGEIILFIDSDCVPPPDWIDQHVQEHSRDCVAVGGSIVNNTFSENSVGVAGYIGEFRDFIPQQPRGYVPHLPTCNISYKKEAFENYGNFNDRYYPQEDLVFNHNLTQQGEKIFFAPWISVAHILRTEFSGFFKHQFRIGAATALVLNKIKLEGSFFVRHRFISSPLILLLPLVKFWRTLAIFKRLNSRFLLKNLTAIPIFAAGLMSWFGGFVYGVYRK